MQRAQYADLKIYLPNDVLVKVDRMSMVHALEVRAPLLDRRIVEFGFSVPPATKMPGLAPKHLLRTIGRRRLPPEILDLPKAGFTMPIGEWIAGPYAGQFRDEVLGAGSHVRDWVETHVSARSWKTTRPATPITHIRCGQSGCWSAGAA